MFACIEIKNRLRFVDAIGQQDPVIRQKCLYLHTWWQGCILLSRFYIPKGRQVVITECNQPCAVRAEINRSCIARKWPGSLPEMRLQAGRNIPALITVVLCNRDEVNSVPVICSAFNFAAGKIKLVPQQRLAIGRELHIPYPVSSVTEGWTAEQIVRLNIGVPNIQCTFYITSTITEVEQRIITSQEISIGTERYPAVQGIVGQKFANNLSFLDITA